MVVPDEGQRIYRHEESCSALFRSGAQLAFLDIS